MLIETSAEVYLKEGDLFLERNDLIQASEKYYKAAEEAIKYLAIKYNVDVLTEVRKINRWRADLLFLAAYQLSHYYDNVKEIWKSAWILHVEGFHEARLSKDQIKFFMNKVKLIINLLS